MAEENKDQRTKEEKKADLRLKDAEAKKVEAEVDKLEAETRKAVADAVKAEVESQKAWSSREKELLSDEENNLYRFSKSVDSNSVAACMSRLTQWHRRNPKCDMEIIFSSPGGSIIDGFELFDFIQELRSKGHKMITGSLGMAASMAGILLMAGDVRWIGHQSWLMIHRAAFGAIGKTFEVEDEVKFVKRIEARILDIFTSRSVISRRKVMKNWDRKDWWISADECLELGLVDEIRAMMPEHHKAKE